MNAPANIINHIVLVLDASTSMQGRNANALVKVADNQIKHLAERSTELDQETRVTVYTFGSHDRFGFPARVDCLIYDKDVLRMPSIAGIYHPFGNTPLVDATWQALDELAETPERHGEHSFLVYVITDGIENISRHNGPELSRKIRALPSHWTLGTFVPDYDGQARAIQHGFPVDNIAIWDTTSAIGLEKAGEQMREATENFMQARRTGVRGTKNLFTLATPKLSEVKKKLTPLHPGQYRLFNVGDEAIRIDELVERETHRAYLRGEGYYQLVKREKVQPQKKIAIMGSKGLFIGDEARDLLGLPDHEETVGPTWSSEYDIYVQSTSNNRKMIPGQKLLVLS